MKEDKVRQSPKSLENINNISHNPIQSGENQKGQSNPIAPRKTANRLYGGYNVSKKINGFHHNIEPLELFDNFCCEAMLGKKSIIDIFNDLHLIAANRLGYSFTGLALMNNQSNYLNMKLIDHNSNVYSSKIFLSENKNPIISSFLNKTRKDIDNNDFINIPYIQGSCVTILPLVGQDKCIGVFVAGSSVKEQQSDSSLKLLVNYLTLLIINKQLSEKASQDSNIDGLTGLKNHGGFQERLSLELKKAKENNKCLSVILFDINNISQINREFGHSKGDEMICLVADKAKQNIREKDIAGRYGGDEIAIILPDTDNDEARKIAEYLDYTISCAFVDDVGPVKVSIGIATYPTCTKEQEKLMLLSEQTMLISKNKGYKNGKSIVVSSQDIDFWNEMALDSLANVIAKRHAQWGLNFEEEIVEKFHNESLTSKKHIIDVVSSLAGAIDAKDPYTKGHSQAVSRYAEALAKALNFPEHEVEHIKLAAMLHDVGKIGIPESILAKPGALTDSEWEVMKQHPTIGAKKVLEPVGTLGNLIPLVKHHHENWNGTGYPDKLAGENIPLGARIIAVADTFHALVSDRPYRKALTIDKAIEILRTGAGTQWDKDLIRQFIIIAPSLCTKV